MNPETSPTPRYRLTAFFLIAAVFAWLAPDFWLRNEIRLGSVAGAYENSDLYQSVYPSFEYGFGVLRNGRIPLWNPTQLCGTPYQADPRMGLFQPLNVLFLLFSTEQAMALHAFLCLFLMGSFFALFARSLGIGYMPALIGGIAYAFSGSAAGVMSRPEMACALAWTPFVFWAANEYIRRSRKAMAAVAGIGLGLLILSGVYALLIALLVVLVPFLLVGVLYPWPSSHRAARHRIAGIGIMAAVALVVSAIQWLPAIAWIKGLEDPAAIIWRLRMAAQAPASSREVLAQLLSSGPGALPRLAYLGIPVLLFIPVSLLHRAQRRDAVFFFLAAGVLLAMLLPTETDLPFTFPRTGLLFPFAFCLAVLSAVGADRLLQPRRDHKSPPVWLPLSAVLSAVALVSLMTDSQGRGYVVAFLCILLPFLLVRARWLAPLCGLAMAALLFTDLSVANVNTYRHPYQDAPACYQQHQSAIEFSRQQSLGGRILVASSDLDTGLPANLGMLTGLPVVGAANLPLTQDQAIWWRSLTAADSPSIPDHLIVSRDAPAPTLIDFMAARIALVASGAFPDDGNWQQNGPRLRLVQETGNVRAFVNEDAYPRTYWTSSCLPVSSTEDAINALASGETRAAKGCVVHAPSQGLSQLQLPQAPAETPASMSGEEPTCSVEDVSPERVVVRVQAPTHGLTILADTFAPGWKARLDGVPCPILQANGLFRGVPTPPGQHEIIFEYMPPGYQVGRVISLTGLAILALVGLIALGRSL